MQQFTVKPDNHFFTSSPLKFPSIQETLNRNWSWHKDGVESSPICQQNNCHRHKVDHHRSIVRSSILSSFYHPFQAMFVPNLHRRPASLCGSLFNSSRNGRGNVSSNKPIDKIPLDRSERLFAIFVLVIERGGRRRHVLLHSKCARVAIQVRFAAPSRR